MNGDPTLETLAETFGKCVAACPPPTCPEEDDRFRRLRRIANVLDRFARTSATRPFRAARARHLYEAMISLGRAPAQPEPRSIWAAT